MGGSAKRDVTTKVCWKGTQIFRGLVLIIIVSGSILFDYHPTNQQTEERKPRVVVCLVLDFIPFCIVRALRRFVSRANSFEATPHTYGFSHPYSRQKIFQSSPMFHFVHPCDISNKEVFFFFTQPCLDHFIGNILLFVVTA